MPASAASSSAVLSAWWESTMTGTLGVSRTSSSASVRASTPGLSSRSTSVMSWLPWARFASSGVVTSSISAAAFSSARTGAWRASSADTASTFSGLGSG